MIPFWIRIKRLPLHFWHDEMLRCIGKEIGSYEKHELTKTTARVRVLVNGLNPLIKETIIEYETREESRITLEYERLAIGFRPRSTWISGFSIHVLKRGRTGRLSGGKRFAETHVALNEKCVRGSEIIWKCSSEIF
ncbi:hypothetical protein YC2023_114768 [Brassica napus]